MDNELMDRVRHLAKDGISAEVKTFGRAIVALTDEIAKLRDDLKEARQEIKEAKSSAGMAAPAKPTIRMPGFAQAEADSDNGGDDGDEPEVETPFRWSCSPKPWGIWRIA